MDTRNPFYYSVERIAIQNSRMDWRVSEYACVFGIASAKRITETRCCCWLLLSSWSIFVAFSIEARSARLCIVHYVVVDYLGVAITSREWFALNRKCASWCFFLSYSIGGRCSMPSSMYRIHILNWTLYGFCFFPLLGCHCMLSLFTVEHEFRCQKQYTELNEICRCTFGIVKGLHWVMGICVFVHVKW